MYDLTPGEKNSALWKKLHEHLEERLEKARLQLESSLSIDETNRVRGKILELKAFLQLGDDKPTVE